MALITVPATLKFTDVEIWLDRVSSAVRSPFTGKRQVRKRPYDIWRLSGGVVPLDPMDAGSMRSFLVQLAGQTNTFKLPVPGAKYPLSKYVGPEGLVNGGNQSGKSISTDGWTPGAVLVKNGDYFNIGDELKIATADIAANGVGVAVLSFDPPLRNKPADNAQIKVRDPYVVVSADNDDIARWRVTPPIRHAFNIEATEAF